MIKKKRIQNKFTTRLMEWNEVRKRNKQLLSQWHKLKRKLKPLKICQAREIKPGEKIKEMPKECFDKWIKLLEEEKAIFDEIARLYEYYYREHK